MITRTPMKLMLLFVFSLCCFTTSSACELLGFSFNEPVPANHLLTVFRQHGNSHPHGWGVAAYTDETAAVFKEPANAAESELAAYLANSHQLNTRLLIAHVRYASVGHQSRKNTHPFTREWQGREWTLAHNGTLRNFHETLPLGRFSPIGTTDSEYLLCYLLGRMEADSIIAWTPETFDWLHQQITTANATGSLNCLFSDSDYLFAYFDQNGYNSLYYLQRQAPYGPVPFTDTEKGIDLRDLYPETAAGMVIATKPLTTEEWVPFQPGQLLVFKDGMLIFSTEALDSK